MSAPYDIWRSTVTIGTAELFASIVDLDRPHWYIPAVREIDWPEARDALVEAGASAIAVPTPMALAPPWKTVWNILATSPTLDGPTSYPNVPTDEANKGITGIIDTLADAADSGHPEGLNSRMVGEYMTRYEAIIAEGGEPSVDVERAGG